MTHAAQPEEKQEMTLVPFLFTRIIVIGLASSYYLFLVRKQIDFLFRCVILWCFVRLVRVKASPRLARLDDSLDSTC